MDSRMFDMPLVGKPFDYNDYIRFEIGEHICRGFGDFNTHNVLAGALCEMTFPSGNQNKAIQRYLERLQLDIQFLQETPIMYITPELFFSAKIVYQIVGGVFNQFETAKDIQDTIKALFIRYDQDPTLLLTDNNVNLRLN